MTEKLSNEYDRGWRDGFYMGQKFWSPNWFLGGMVTMIAIDVINQILNYYHAKGVL